jgi:hypothetical protein
MSDMIIDGSATSVLSEEVSTGIVSAAKTAAENLLLRNPMAATVVGGALIGVGATLLAIKVGPQAIRLARSGAARAAAWVSSKMSREKAAEQPIRPVPPPADPEPA